MRTTVRLDDESLAAVEQLQREQNVGLSEAVNQLVHRGLKAVPTQRTFRQKTHDLGLRIDVSNVAEALELLDDLDANEPDEPGVKAPRHDR